MLSGGSTCRGRDENSNGLCSCGLPRSEALRVASTLATALTTVATSSCVYSGGAELHSADPCQDTSRHHLARQGCAHYKVE